MHLADLPSRSALAGRAAGLVGVLRGLPAWSPHRRRLSEETIRVLAGAGVFRLRAPRAYGGFDRDTETLVGVAVELGRASGPAAFLACATWVPTWLAAGSGALARAEVFARPDVVVCGPVSARSRPVPGGWVLDGRWASVPGVLHARWQAVVTVAGGRPSVALVPVADLRVVDGADVTDLTGAGAAGVVAEAVFVPAHRMSPLPAGSLAGVRAASWVGLVVGLAKDARDWYLEELVTDHGPSFAGGPAVPALLSHVQAGHAFTALSSAERAANDLASTVDSGAVPAPDAVDEICRLAGDTVHLLAAISGPGSSVHRVARDLAAVTGHLLAEEDTDVGDLAAGRPYLVDRPATPPPPRKEIR